MANNGVMEMGAEEYCLHCRLEAGNSARTDADRPGGDAHDRQPLNPFRRFERRLVGHITGSRHYERRLDSTRNARIRGVAREDTLTFPTLCRAL